MRYRKFLLLEDSDFKDVIDKNNKEKRLYYFTKINPCETISYHFESEKYFKKTQNSYHKSIDEISKKLFFKNSKKRVGRFIKKDIYFLDKDSFVEIYKDDLNVSFYFKYFKNQDQLKEFLKSDFYNKYIDEDVTFDDRFSDISLAKFGSKVSNIYSIFKNIKKRGKSMKKVIYKDMNTTSAIRIELFLLYTKLLQIKNDILKDHKSGEDQIATYRKILQKILFLLKDYKKSFDNDVVSKVIENLQMIYEHTSMHKRIVAIRENFHTLKECLNKKSFESFLRIQDEAITKEVEIFLNFLKTKEHAIILKQLELLIKEGENDKDAKYEKSIKKSLDKKIKKALKKFKKAYKKNIECDSFEGIEKIVKRLKKIETLRGEFKYLFDNEIFYKEEKLYEELLEKLNSLSNLLLLEELIKQNIDKEDDVECLVKVITNKKQKLLKKVKKSFKKI